MRNRSVSPSFAIPGGPVQTLDRLPREHTKFNEQFLQALLADHPELLPIEDLRDDVGYLLCIGREVVVPSGVIDSYSASQRRTWDSRSWIYFLLFLIVVFAVIVVSRFAGQLCEESPKPDGSRMPR